MYLYQYAEINLMSVLSRIAKLKCDQFIDYKVGKRLTNQLTEYIYNIYLLWLRAGRENNIKVVQKLHPEFYKEYNEAYSDYIIELEAGTASEDKFAFLECPKFCKNSKPDSLGVCDLCGSVMR